VKPRLVVIGPLPPPYHGVTVSTSLVLKNPSLSRQFAVEHVDTSDPRSLANVARWDAQNIILALRSVQALLRRRPDSSTLVYLPLSQSAPGFFRDSLLIRVAAMRKAKVAAHLRGSEFRDFYARSPRLLRWWIRSSLARLDSIAVMGRSLRWVFEGLVPDERIVVVPNGTPEPAATEVQRNGRKVLFFSNLAPRKGVEESLEAARLVLEEEPSIDFLFVGSPRDEAFECKMRERAAEFDQIRILPAVDLEEKDRLLASASILLFPPVEPEGHPRVVLEALAAGLPVVTTNRGAIAETVIDGECGFVLEDPVPDQLAARLLTLLRDDDLRTRMGEAARLRYRERFTQRQADDRLADWLAEVSERS